MCVLGTWLQTKHTGDQVPSLPVVIFWWMARAKALPSSSENQDTI